jgi:branched-chain amino acid aminotransferase
MHAKRQGFHDALLLDDQGYVAETTASNVFFVKNKVLFTTPLGTILPGLTREALIALAERAGLIVKEMLFKPEALLSADEAFVCGTAVEVRPIGQLDNQVIGTGIVGPITQQLMTAYQAARSGEIPEFSDWLTRLS